MFVNVWDYVGNQNIEYRVEDYVGNNNKDPATPTVNPQYSTVQYSHTQQYITKFSNYEMLKILLVLD